MEQKSPVTEQEVIRELRRRQQEQLRKVNRWTSILTLIICALFLGIVILRTL